MRFTAAAIALALLPASFAVSLAPRRTTPDFYLIIEPGLHAVRGDASGNTLNVASGNPTKFFLVGNGDLGVDVPQANTIIYVNFQQIGVATCASQAELEVVTGSSSNKCAKHSQFYISSYNQNSQLGAKLMFNGVGDFYLCGSEIHYSSGGAPDGCSRIDLWTVPAE